MFLLFILTVIPLRSLTAQDPIGDVRIELFLIFNSLWTSVFVIEHLVDGKETLDWLTHVYPPQTRKRLWRFYFGRIRSRLGVDLFPSFPIHVLTSFRVDLLPIQSHQTEIIIVKHIIQGHNNVTRVRVELRSCNLGRLKYDALTLLATLPTKLGNRLNSIR